MADTVSELLRRQLEWVEQDDCPVRIGNDDHASAYDLSWEDVQRLLASTQPVPAFPREEVEPPSEDWLADVLDDSLDMDWTGRVGARAIIAAWETRHD